MNGDKSNTGQKCRLSLRYDIHGRNVSLPRRLNDVAGINMNDGVLNIGKLVPKTVANSVGNIMTLENGQGRFHDDMQFQYDQLGK